MKRKTEDAPQIGKDEVTRALSRVKIGKRGGVDSLDAEMVAWAVNSDAAVTLIQNLVNEALRTGKVPQLWKKSIVCPVPKPGPENVGRYRPISLLSIYVLLFC